MRIWQAVVELRTVSPVSVASPESARSKGDVDLPIARDPSGRPYIHASSIAGALRQHAARVNPEWEHLLFGGPAADLPEDSSEGDAVLTPSAVRFLGTSVDLGESTHTRAQTAISRWSGSAASGALRTRESLPPGTAIKVFLVAENLSEEQSAALRDCLKTWTPRLGGATSTGFGDTTVVSVSQRKLDLAREADLRVWLSNSGPSSFAGAGFTELKLNRAVAQAPHQIKFRLTGDLRVGTGRARESVLLLERDAEKRPMIPGTSWKGVFRSRAEFILRTVGIGACRSTDDGACGVCAACQLFGYSARGTGTGPIGQRSRVRFWDSPVENATEAKRTHVSIDRFTGGAARGRLFTEEVVATGKVTVRFQIDEAVESWALPLLQWVARDINDGYVGVGHGTTRGLGFLELQIHIEPDSKWQNRCRDYLEAHVPEGDPDAQ